MIASGPAFVAMIALQAVQARSAAKAALTVSKAQAEGGASLALSTARTGKAQTALSLVQNSLRRQAFTRQGGTAMEALTLNAINADRSAVAASVEGQLAEAEATGSRIAFQGAAGMSTAADAIDLATSLRYARAARRSEEVRRITNYNFAEQAEAMGEQVWHGTQVQTVVPGYVPTPQNVQVGAVPSFMGSVLAGALRTAAADPKGFATMFSPSAAGPSNALAAYDSGVAAAGGYAAGLASPPG